VAALAHAEPATTFAARQADLVFVTPTGTDDVHPRADAVRRGWEAAGREPQPLHVWGDLVVHLAPTETEAADRRAHLDDLAGGDQPSDAATFTGTPEDLADLITAWADAGLTGVRLRPAALPHDLDAIVDGLVPALQARGRNRTAYELGTLRDRLGLDRPADRYATTTAGVPS
jgi:alkanesulfonate monooxygenase SsuD/methylene tetrahydromethanopterin reductase-like flavin-dependent oxidoreductase (luciferase family)